MRILAGLFVIPVIFGQVDPRAQVDPKALLRQSVENYNHTWRAGIAWAYTTTDVTESSGEKDVTVTEVIPIGGTPYDRVVVKEGQKLKGEDATREQQKFEKPAGSAGRNHLQTAPPACGSSNHSTRSQTTSRMRMTRSSSERKPLPGAPHGSSN